MAIARVFSISVTLLISLSVLTCLLTAPRAAPAAARQSAKPIIVEAQSYPWSALGRVNTGGRGFCTGVLISARHVLSEGRCLFNGIEGRWWSATELHFVAGYERDRYLVDAAVSDYRLAPGFAGGLTVTLADLLNNWALLTLSSPIGYEAGWLTIDWFDDRSRRRSEGEEIQVLEVGYRRRQPHVVTVAPGCHNLDGADSCDLSRAETGLLSLLLVAGELRVEGSSSMRRDSVLKQVSARASFQTVVTRSRAVPQLIEYPMQEWLPRISDTADSVREEPNF